MSTLKISLKQNERIYINGAVVRFDRKTSLEFLNDVQFLLESQVLQVEDANTPLKQLYFAIQVQLMSPKDSGPALRLFDQQLADLLNSVDDQFLANELKNIDRMVKEQRLHEAMKTLRSLLTIEQRNLEKIETSFPFEEVHPRQAAIG